MPGRIKMFRKNILMNSWKKLTKLEKHLSIATGILVLLTLCLIISIGVISTHKKDNSNFLLPSHICLSSSCKTRGEEVKRWINHSVDPCDDFYHYCCDGWLQENQPPKTSSIYGSIEKLELKIAEDIKKVLTNIKPDKYTSRPINQTVSFYNACMDLDGIKNRGIAPLHSLLQEIGGWPIISSDWNHTDYDWLEIIARLVRKTASGYIVRFIVSPDVKNTSYNIIQLDQPILSLDRDVLLQPNSTSLEKYKTLIKEMALVLNPNADESQLNDDIEGIINFERKLAELLHNNTRGRIGADVVEGGYVTNYCPTSDQPTNREPYTAQLKEQSHCVQGVEGKCSVINMSFPKMSSIAQEFEKRYNKNTVKEFEKEIPKFPFLRYLQLITNETLTKLEQPVTEKELIIIRDFPYFEKLAEFIKNDEKSKRQIANYLGWRVVEKHNNHLPEEFQTAIRKYNKISQDSVPERWKLCVSLTNVALGYAVANVYIKRNFQSPSKCDIRQMVDELKSSFSNIIKSTEWMDEQTKQEALRKVDAVRGNVGYPDWIMEKRSLTEFYKNMGNIGKDPFENDLIVSTYTSSDFVRTLREKPKMDDWPMMPLTVNAAYNQNQNSITVPSAILQIPFYDWKLPRYLNYAAIGAVIGHELTHGFDTRGSERDANGVISNWWTDKSKEEFKNRTECFVEQYNSYNMDGLKTLAENIADNGGLRQAYLVYKTWEKEKEGHLEKLPYLEDYTFDQLFFINYGLMWCTHYTKNAWNYTVSSVDHSPSIYRVWGPVSNSKEFSEAFKCKRNSKMNMENKCRIW